MPNVRMPDGRVVAFPDDMPRSEMIEYVNANKRQVEEEEERRRLEEIERKRDEVGIMGAFGRGLSRGLTQTRGLVADVLPAVIGDALGAEEYRDRQMQEYLDKMKKMEEERPSLVPSYEDIEGAGDLAKFSLETLGQFVPSMATSIAGGGIGGFLGQQVAKGAAKKMATKSAEEYAKKIAKGRFAGKIAGASAGSGIQTIPEAYATIEEETGDPHLGWALTVGSVNAALDSILPAAFLSRIGKESRDEISRNIVAQTLRKIGTTAGKTRKGTIAKSALKSGVVEFLPEGTQEFNQLAASRILDENPEFWESGDFERIMDATIRGGIGGKAFGAMSGMLSETETQKARRKKQEQDNDLVTALEIIQRGEDPILIEDHSDATKSVNALKKQNVSPRIKKILNDDNLLDAQKIERINQINKHLETAQGKAKEAQEAPLTKEQKQKRGNVKWIYRNDEELAEQIINASEVIEVGTGVIPPALQITFDPNAKDSEAELKRVRKEASKTLPYHSPIKQILNSKDFSTPKKLEIFDRWVKKERERLSKKTDYDKGVDEANKVLKDQLGSNAVEVNKKDIPLTDARPTEYRVIDAKGKVMSTPYDNIELAEQDVQERKKPENFRIIDQKNDVVYKGKPFEPSIQQQAVDKRTAEQKILTPTKQGLEWEASARGLADPAQDPFADEVADVDQQARGTIKPETPQLIPKSSEQYINSVNLVNARIDEIASKNEQGKKIARSLREVINDPNRTVGQMSTAFHVADIMSSIMPGKADHALKFVDVIGKGEEVGIRNAHAKLISLAYNYGKDGKLVTDENVIKETASHEAFHVLQDYFLQYDPSARKILDAEFGSTQSSGELIDYSNSRTAKWLKRVNSKLHEDLLKMNAEVRDGDKVTKKLGLTGREIQAHAFSAYDQARREGNTPVMAGGLARYFRFASQFLQRLGNFVRGLGFQNAQDVFESVSSGTASKTFSSKTLATAQTADAEASSRGQDKGRYLTRQGGEIYTPPADRNKFIRLDGKSPVLTKVTRRKGERYFNVALPYGERYWDTFKEMTVGFGSRLIMNPGNVNLIKMNTPHTEVGSFIQDVLSNGKKEIDGDSIYYNYKPPGYKQVGVVHLEQDREQPTFMKLMNAYARDEKEINRLREEERQSEVSRLQQRAKAVEGATVEDIEAYRRSRGIEASARGVAVGYEEFVTPNNNYSQNEINQTKSELGIPSNSAIFPNKSSKANIDQQITRLEETEANFNDPLSSEQNWLDTLSFAYNDNKDILVPPSWLLRSVNNPQKWAAWLGDLKEDQLTGAAEGFSLVDELGGAYASGRARPELTGQLFLWAFLSRMQSAFPHESGFLDFSNKALPFIEKALRGDFTHNEELITFSGTRNKSALESAIKNKAVPENLKKYVKRLKEKKFWLLPHEVAVKGRSDMDDWILMVNESIPADSPGRMTTNNLNAFGRDFLRVMSRRNSPEEDTRLMQIHRLLASELDGKAIRREFYRTTEGESVGFSNKILSFALLMSGRKDVFVLDRIQINQMWTGGQSNGKVYDGLSQAFNGLRGLVLYEAMERSALQRINKLYQDAGRNPNEASLGRYHWESWVRSSGQVVGHPTIQALINFSKNKNNPTLGVGSTEGRFHSKLFNIQYFKDENGNSQFVYDALNGDEILLEKADINEALDKIT